MKVWRDFPEELEAWRERALARRRAMINANPDKDWDDYELPYIPSEYTVSVDYAVWRKINAGTHV